MPAFTLNDSGEITLTGGEGIGTVTRKGIGLPLGSAAINRTPRHTIESAVRESDRPGAWGRCGDFCPGRRSAGAKKRITRRLGILGGISIIGTTGIVTPMSEESWKRSLSLELENQTGVRINAGDTRAGQPRRTVCSRTNGRRHTGSRHHEQFLSAT
ncbi:cobalt-precorrin-6A synthase [Salmonella enterica subsp. enterica]|uniref:Cobalt-precorrin-6A synthase n=1 Tax=Salmonella enterica I TaxID=59201 RepID=A0A447U0W5_SALET|nr:cobalt-precorrin-6A synthase [Salmonella enterica subsp. enterica]